MCGRYTLLDTNEIYDRFGVAEDNLDLKNRYNIAPGQQNPVVIRQSPKKLTLMKWGLIPVWAKDIKTGFKMINTRSESIIDKPYFKRLVKSHRCLIPASGFYEWAKKGEVKQPYYFTLKNVHIFAFAGLFDRYEDQDGNEHLTYTIITTKPNTLLKKVHDRMPVILNKKDEELWLDPDEKDHGFLTSLLEPFSSKKMEMIAVSTKVNSIKNVTEDLIKPVT